MRTSSRPAQALLIALYITVLSGRPSGGSQRRLTAPSRTRHLPERSPRGPQPSRNRREAADEDDGRHHRRCRGAPSQRRRLEERARAPHMCARTRITWRLLAWRLSCGSQPPHSRSLRCGARPECRPARSLLWNAAGSRRPERRPTASGCAGRGPCGTPPSDPLPATPRGVPSTPLPAPDGCGRPTATAAARPLSTTQRAASLKTFTRAPHAARPSAACRPRRRRRSSTAKITPPPLTSSTRCARGGCNRQPESCPWQAAGTSSPNAARRGRQRAPAVRRAGWPEAPLAQPNGSGKLRVACCS